MSLTSYRAAPPRVKALAYIPVRIVYARFALIFLFVCFEKMDLFVCFADLAATYSPAS